MIDRLQAYFFVAQTEELSYSTFNYQATEFNNLFSLLYLYHQSNPDYKYTYVSKTK
jgi:hypothetical protein